MGELMKNGCTTVFDHHYVFPANTGDLLAAQSEAASRLGVDGIASNDGSNLLEELRVCCLLHRLTSGERAPTGCELLKTATMGGARLLGRETEIGSLEPGKCADFFLLRKDRLELVGACLDPKALLCTVGLKGPVDMTVVHGRVTVEDGRLTGIDEDALIRSAEAEVARYLHTL